MKRGGSKKKSIKRVVPALVEVVPLWRRAFAYVVDLLIISFIIYLPMKGLFGDVPDGEINSLMNYFSARPDLTFSFFMVSLIIGFLTVMYWALLEFYISQSIGKIAMKIKVRSLIGKLTFKQCFFRNLSKVSTFLLFLDMLYGIFKKDNRRYFEVMSGTQVVKVDG